MKSVPLMLDRLVIGYSFLRTRAYSISPSGVLVQLCYPYPRAVSEPAVYEDANVVTTGLTDEEVEQLKERLAPKSSPSTAAKRLSNAPPPPPGEQGASGKPSSRSGSVSTSMAQYKPDLSVGYIHSYNCLSCSA